jgi:hypothetical protein
MYLKNFFWGMCFFDPYQGYIYNKLHCSNLGTFGTHLWPLAKQVLKQLGTLGELTAWFVLLHFIVSTLMGSTGCQIFHSGVVESTLMQLQQLTFPMELRLRT